MRDNEVWIPNEAKETGKFSGEFYVMSNDPKYPVINIPFKGEVTEMIGQNQVKTFKQEEKISCSSRVDCSQKCHNIDLALDGICVANECICAYP